MRLWRQGALVALTCSAVLFLSGQAHAAPVYPPVDGWIVDEAEQVPDDVEARIEADLEAYFQSTDNEVAIAVVRDMGGASVEDYARELFNTWGVGDKKRNTGVLLVIAMQERELRIQTGFGAEDYVTDSEAQQIIDEYVTPQMRAGDVGAAVDLGQRAIRAAMDQTSQNAGIPPPNELPPGQFPTDPIGPDAEPPPDDSNVSPYLFLLPFAVVAGISTMFGGRSRRRHGLGGMWGYPIFYGGGDYGGHRGGIGGFGGGSGSSSGGGGDSGGGGGFGGFGGGSSGGGGASGSW